MEKSHGCGCKKKRIAENRNENPSYGIIDSQSTKTAYASEERGIDGEKKVKGRKKHIIVDIMGNILAIVIHAANIHDTVGGIQPVRQAMKQYPNIEKFCGDDGYRKTFEIDVWWEFGLGVDISARIKPQFEVLPKRWVVERTFAWLGNYRRLSKDFEISIDSAEDMVRIAHFHTILRSIA